MFNTSKKPRNKKKLVPGMKVLCFRRAPWKENFTGIVEKIYENSICVRILSTSLEDDLLVVERKGRTIVPIKSCSIMEEN